MKSVIIKKMEVTTLLMLKTNELITCIDNIGGVLLSTSLFFISFSQCLVIVCLCFLPLAGDLWKQKSVVFFTTISVVWRCQTIWPAAWLQPFLLCLNISSALGQCLPLSPLSGDGQQTVSGDTIMCLLAFRLPFTFLFFVFTLICMQCSCSACNCV